MKISSIQKIIIFAILIILLLGALIFWSVAGTIKVFISSSGEVSAEQVKVVYSFSGMVLSVDAENDFLMVKADKDQREVKVNVTEMTRLTEIGFPFDPANPPEGVVFTPTQTDVELSDFEAGDTVFIKSKGDIFGKTEISDIDFIQILP